MAKELAEEKYFYWYYRINERYPAERQTDQMKEAIIFLEEVFFAVNNRDFKEDPKNVAALVELKLRVPKVRYNLNYEDFLEKPEIKNIKIDYSNFINRPGFPPVPSIEHIGRRYELFIHNPRAEATNNKPLTEAIDSLISMVTPRPVKDKFYEFICSLPDDDNRCPLECKDLKSEDVNYREKSNVSENLNYFHQDKDTETWTINFKGKYASYPHRMGLSYIAYLLGHPGEDVSSISLVIQRQGISHQNRFIGNTKVQMQRFDEDGLTIENQEDEIDLVDKKFIKEIQGKIGSLEEEIEELKNLNDLGRVEGLEDELMQLIDYRNKNINKNRKPRKYLTSQERARTNVQKSIKSAIIKIKNNNPSLASYLENHIKTGRKCCFIPDSDDPPWSIS